MRRHQYWWKCMFAGLSSVNRSRWTSSKRGDIGIRDDDVSGEIVTMKHQSGDCATQEKEKKRGDVTDLNRNLRRLKDSYMIIFDQFRNAFTCRSATASVAPRAWLGSRTWESHLTTDPFAWSSPMEFSSGFGTKNMLRFVFLPECE